jgi:DNA-binding response OmpR family regulator
VFEAEDGRAALVVLAERAIDLIITDLTMPGLDGNGLIAELTGRPNPPPIIVMSAMRLQTLDEDIAASLQKPFDLEMLILVVERVLSEAALT